MDINNLPKITSLRFEKLGLSFENQDALFSGVDFDFPMNEIVWIKAQSGAGRSSLLQLLAGLQMPNKGSYYVNEQNVTEMSFEEFLPYRLSIGYSFDFGGLINNRTLLENCTLGLTYHKMCTQQEADERVRNVFNILGIGKHADKRPALVPGGVKKLVCLIRPLCLQPQVLLLDDPSVGVGQETILKYFDLVNDLRKRGFASHVFISSFDDKMMGLLPYTEIHLDNGLIYSDQRTHEKRVANL